jgi:hypothetical protein
MFPIMNYNYILVNVGSMGYVNEIFLCENRQIVKSCQHNFCSKGVSFTE